MSNNGSVSFCVICRAEGNSNVRAAEDGYCDAHLAELTRAEKAAGFLADSVPVRQGTRNEEQGTTTVPLHSPPSSLVPSLKETSSPSLTRGPEVEQLLALHAAGKVEPVPVELPGLPDGATAPMREVAEFFKLVHGLRLYAGMPAEVPFACGWVAKKIGKPKPTVHRVLGELEDAGVLRQVGSLEGRGKRGTFLWVPGGAR